MKHTLLSLGVLCAAALGTPAMAADQFIYAGTWTNMPDEIGSATYPEGIYGFRFNPETGQLTSLGLVARTPMPDSLAASPSGHALFASRHNGCVCLMGFPFPGAPKPVIQAYAVDPASGAIKLQTTVDATGDVPADIRVSPDGQTLAVGTFYGGTVGTFHIASDGRLSNAVSIRQHSGPSVHYPEGPHAHGIGFSPDNRWLYVAELGLDRVYRYPIDPETAALLDTPPASIQLPEGSGPRHVAVHPNGKWLYVNNEQGGSITALQSAEAGLKEIGTVPLMPADADVTAVGAAEIRMSPDGRLLYANSRSYEGVSVFAIDGKTGALKFLQFARTDMKAADGASTPALRKARIDTWRKLPTPLRVGSGARAFTLDATGNWLISANLAENRLVVLKRDPQTGLLSPTKTNAFVPHPSGIAVLEVAK